MNGNQVVKSAFAGAHNWYLGTTADVTAEQANEALPGLGHTIGVHMAHTVQCEDFFVNTVVLGRPTLWEQDGWNTQVGGELIVSLPGGGFAELPLYDPAGLGAYAVAVFANTDSVLDGLSDSDLDRELALTELGFPMNMSVGGFLSSVLAGNTFAHTGEISALKGTQGSQGYPF